MGLVELIRGRVNGPPPLEADRLRKSKPVRNPDVSWESAEDGSVRLKAPFEVTARGMAAVLHRWAKAPATKEFELEAVGALVWELCDGRHTFDTISKRLRERYKMNRLEADAALTAFLQTLTKKGLITLMVPKQP